MACGHILDDRTEEAVLNGIGFVNCGTRWEISFIPEIASKECLSCMAEEKKQGIGIVLFLY